MRDQIPTAVVVDGASLWKWVQLYTNNWRLHPCQIKAVSIALMQSYWQAVISWNELFRTQRLLGKTESSVKEDYPASDLTLALSYFGKVIHDQYKIVDIRGFIDQGILFQAQKGEQSVTLLCLTTKAVIPPHIYSLHPQLVDVHAVIETSEHIFLELSPLIGQPLCVWLNSQYPTGLPPQVANLLLRQIYQLMTTLRTLGPVLYSIHPGQLFIDTDSLTLQLIPCASDIKPYMRGRLYQCEGESEDQSSLGYRLLAIAYELFTGCVPDKQYPLHHVLKACKNLSYWQKRQIEQCLTRTRTVSLSKAALILDANKKYVVRDTALLAIASVFALAAFTWQGIQYVPVWLTQDASNEETPNTIVIEQGSKDSHVNSLKAAFFTQIQENNFAGATVSWQALQKILPDDDIFIEKIGPELLGNHEVMIREPISMYSPPVLESVVEEKKFPELSEDDFVALPPLPEIKHTQVEAALEAVIITDPCERALAQQGDVRAAACIDALSLNNQWGPRLLATKIQKNKVLVIMQQAVSVADYNQYCMSTSNCTVSNAAAPLDLELTEIENTVHDYNAYCLTSGLCETLDVPVEPMHALTQEQIEAYALWLSTETGFTYRIPTLSEWQTLGLTFNQTQENIEWLLDDAGLWTTTLEVDSNHPKRQQLNSNNNIAFRLVRENKS